VDLEEIRQRLLSAHQEGRSPAQVFKDMGIAPGEGEKLKSLLLQAGVEEDLLKDQEAVKSFIEGLTQGFTPEMRHQMGQLIQGIAREINEGRPLPPEIEDFLERWMQKQGE